MKTLRQIAVTTLFVFVCALMAFTVLAQTNTPPATGSGSSAVPMIAVWNALVVAVVPLIVAGIKKLAPKIPSVVWPLAAVLVGVASNWLAAKAGVLPQSGWALGALCGAAGIGLREIVDQVKQATGVGNTPAPTPAPPAPPAS